MRDDAHELFVDVVDTLGPLAEHRVRQILGDFAPELVELVTHAPLARTFPTAGGAGHRDARTGTEER
jgi:phenylacetic acid degradation operon negative regulatory protein